MDAVTWSLGDSLVNLCHLLFASTCSNADLLPSPAPSFPVCLNFP